MVNNAALADDDQLAQERRVERPVAAFLDHIARFLLFAMPLLFVVGRAPADIAVSLIAILFFVRSALGLGWFWLRTPWLGAALLFWAYLNLLSLIALSPEDSFSRALPFLRFVLFASALQHWLLVERAAIRTFLAILAAVVAFVLLDCLYQYATGADIFGKTAEGAFRLSGPFNNDVAGTFLAKVSLPLIGWWIAWSAHKGYLSWSVGGALALFIGLVILLTGERTALVSYGMGVAFLALAVKSTRGPLLLIGLLGMIGIGTVITQQDQLRERFVDRTASDFDNFWENRYGIIFVRAVDVWREAPLTGVGLKNFRLTCETDNFEHQGPIDTWCFNHAHNPYLEVLSETGVIGLALFLVMIALILKDIAAGWRPSRQDFPMIAAATASLLMFLWPVMVSKSLFANWNAMLFWLAIGLALCLSSPRATRSPASTCLG
ncbi:MAG: O-antigen ligase family protein [Pseudomonadota bacterium]